MVWIQGNPPQTLLCFEDNWILGALYSSSLKWVWAKCACWWRTGPVGADASPRGVWPGKLYIVPWIPFLSSFPGHPDINSCLPLDISTHVLPDLEQSNMIWKQTSLQVVSFGYHCSTNKKVAKTITLNTNWKDIMVQRPPIVGKKACGIGYAGMLSGRGSCPPSWCPKQITEKDTQE